MVEVGNREPAMHDLDTGSRKKRADPVSAEQQKRAEAGLSMSASTPVPAPGKEGPGGLDEVPPDAATLTQFMIDHSPDSVFWIRVDGRIAYVNEAACRSLEYDRN